MKPRKARFTGSGAVTSAAVTCRLRMCHGALFPVCMILFALTLSPLVGAQSALQVFEGPCPGSRFGFSVGSVGDVDGDGVPDVIVGAPYHTGGAGPCSSFESPDGLVLVLSGADGSLIHEFKGSLEGGLGWSVDGAGTFDGDDVPDLIVGWAEFHPNLSGQTQVHVKSGSTGAIIGFSGQFAFDHHVAVAGAGDLDLDGFADVLHGTRYYSRVDVIRGPSGPASFFVEDSGTGLGSAVSAIGDVNGDGLPDVLAGAWHAEQGAGQVRVYSFVDKALLLTVTGDQGGDLLGISAGSVGDIDHDGIEDFVAGATQADGGGRGYARVYSGGDGAVLYHFAGDALGDRFGTSVSGAGDFTGDGVPDVVVGATQAGNGGPGYARVYSGSDGRVVRSWSGAMPGDLFGHAVSDAGDVNGDGFADVLVGAPDADATGIDSGVAMLLPGCPGNIALYGDGCPGTGGFTPRLVMDGCPTRGSELSLAVIQAVGNSSVWILFGLSQAETSLASGCTFLLGDVLPIALLLPVGGSGPGGGSLMLTGTLPAGTPSATLTLQAFVIDGGVPHGYSATNGVALTIR